VTVRRSEIQQAKHDMVKLLRNAIRTRHAIEADRELNEILPQAEEMFDAAVRRGRLPEPKDFVSKVLKA